METTHTAKPAGLSQCDLILAELRRHEGQWVPMPHLCHISGSYNIHSRIADLRARPERHNIEHKNERENGKLKSSYRLIEAPSQPELF
jgi:hypothetical protein